MSSTAKATTAKTGWLLLGLGTSVSGPFSCAALWAGCTLPAVLRTFGLGGEGVTGLGGEGVTDHPRHQLSHHQRLTELCFSFWPPPSGGMSPIDLSGNVPASPWPLQ